VLLVLDVAVPDYDISPGILLPLLGAICALLRRRAAPPGTARRDARRGVRQPDQGLAGIDRAPTWFRVRQDRVSKAGNVTVRYLSRLRHIGIGKADAGEEVRLLIATTGSGSWGRTARCCGTS
jgi:hypothetical protein